jgi:cyclase
MEGEMRRVLSGVVAGLGALALLGSGASAQHIVTATGEHVTVPVETYDYSGVKLRIADLGNKTYMLDFSEGGGSNVMAAVGDDGVFLIDAKVGPLHDALKAALKSRTSLPVKYVINTNHRNDHTHGNAAFAKEGAVVVAQENLKKNMLAADPKYDPATLPTETYATTKTLTIRGRTAELHHPAPALTDSDTYVFFRDANVLAAGDLYNSQTGFFYFGAPANQAIGGGVDGFIAALDEMLALSDANTKIVPGHGPLASKADMAGFRDMFATARARIAALIAQGKSVDEAVAAKPFADWQANWKVATDRTNDAAADVFTRAIYGFVKAKQRA